MVARPPAGLSEDDAVGELRRLGRLAGPVVLGNLGLVAMSTADVVMVGRVDATELAALAVGNLWSFGVLIFGLGAMRGLDPVFAQAHGAGDTRGGTAALGRAVVLALLLSVPLVLLHLVAGPALGLLGQPTEVLPQAGAYCRAMAWGVPPVLVWSALAQFLQGKGRMGPPAVSVLLGNVLNIGANAALVWGWSGPGGLVVPALGSVGSGVATALVRWLMLLALVTFVVPLVREDGLPRRETVLAWAPLRRAAGLALPVGLQVGLEVWAFSAAGLVMGALGAVEVAAHAVAINLSSLTFMVPFGLGAAAATRVGNLLGAGLPWVRAARVAIGTGAAWMVLTAAVFVAFAAPLVALFTDAPEVVALAATLLPVAAAFQVFDGVQAVTFGVLRGAGDVRLPALFNVLGYWVLGLPIGAGLALGADGGPRAVWVGLVIGLGVVAVLLLARLRVVARQGGVRVPAEP